MPPDTESYVGYRKRSVPEPDRELTSVGPGSACGEWMRRAWQPIAMSQELRDLPLALRILGEDLDPAARHLGGHFPQQREGRRDARLAAGLVDVAGLEGSAEGRRLPAEHVHLPVGDDRLHGSLRFRWKGLRRRAVPGR